MTLLLVLLAAAVATAPAAAADNWTKVNGGGAFDDLFFVDVDYGWSFGGGVSRTTDGGSTWVGQFHDGATAINAGFFFDRSRGWAVGAHGAVLATVDGGQTWTPQVSGTTSDIHAVTFVDAQEGWVTGDLETILHTSDGGAHWEIQVPEYLPGQSYLWSLSAVAFFDADHGCAAGQMDTLVYTADGGQTWHASRHPVGNAGGVAFTGVSDVVVVGGGADGVAGSGADGDSSPPSPAPIRPPRARATTRWTAGRHACTPARSR